MFDHRRWRAWGHRAVLALAISLGGGAAPLLAAMPDVYEVAGVAVDVTAETAAKARDTAIGEGHAKAFRQLLARLTLKADRGRLPELTVNGIAAYVTDFSVANEKTSATRYLASLTFRFKREAIRRLLTDYRLPFAETPSKPVLVLPVFEEAGAVLLWDTPNPWRTAWEETPAPDGLVPLALPLGDLSDIAAIGAEQAVRGDAQRLAAIASRYGAGDSLVAHAIKTVEPRANTIRIDVSTTRYGPTGGGQTLVRAYASAAGETTEALLRRAAAEIAVEVEDDWKRDNLLQFGRPGVIAVTIPIGALSEWLAIRDRMAGMAVIRSTDVVFLSRTEVRANLQFVGTTEQLTLALAQADLALAQEGAAWVLRSLRKGS
ncbi:DUF2066 domain-containing protein [Shumkonia mesophila]|uniref:DUF2066 domain-containing protein n=1 Tax=Shumkonia mesophila TaxID=2838854 RepID=UPI0029345B8A|nr:DUF2066 domain-containing protein [Shumkonia mesophila]